MERVNPPIGHLIPWSPRCILGCDVGMGAVAARKALVIPVTAPNVWGTALTHPIDSQTTQHPSGGDVDENPKEHQQSTPNTGVNKEIFKSTLPMANRSSSGGQAGRAGWRKSDGFPVLAIVNRILVTYPTEELSNGSWVCSRAG